MDGLVISEQSGFYRVEAADGTHYVCRLRGRLKEEAQSSDIVTIGDKVSISSVPAEGMGITEKHGVIESVAQRHSRLSRAVRTTGKRGAGQAEREHVLIANADQAVFVLAVAHPTPNLKMLDRLLVTAEKAHIEQILIVINKIDLEDPALIAAMIAPYRRMQYDMLLTSAARGDGIAELRERLRDRISILTGASGVGKTSLLNQIQPGLGRAVKSVGSTSEGVHTTRDSVLIKLDSGGYLADTPGIRQMQLWDVEPDELDGYFRDIAGYIGQCRFHNCTHTTEPGCAVLAAVNAGQISKLRHDHFLQLREELRDTYIIYR
jgi:ribosome biogenesis GTPase